MKKILPIFAALFLLAISYQVIIIIFIHGYTINYSIVGKDNLFDVTEILYENEKYDFYINDSNGNKFVISQKYNFNKQKGVIKDIAYFRNNDIICILPIFKRDLLGNITCLYDNSQVDYSYLMTNNVDTKSMMTKFKKYGYKIDKNYNNNEKTKEYVLSNSSIVYVYEDNLYKGYTYLMWNYNGIFFINKEMTEEKKYLDKDLYDNSNSRIVGKYYMVFNFNDINTLNEILTVNLDDYGKNHIYIKDTINSNMYINGIYDRKLYVTDLKAKSQYTLNPYKTNFEVFDKNEKYYILKNNKLETISKDDFFKAKYYFNISKVSSINKKYGDVFIYQSENYYYFTKDNIFYKQHKDYSSAIKLFKFDNVTDWHIVDNDIVFISGDTLYLFSEKYGIKPIVRNNEFKYNSKNICNLYKKS